MYLAFVRQIELFLTGVILCVLPVSTPQTEKDEFCRLLRSQSGSDAINVSGIVQDGSLTEMISLLMSSDHFLSCPYRGATT